MYPCGWSCWRMEETNTIREQTYVSLWGTAWVYGYMCLYTYIYVILYKIIYIYILCIHNSYIQCVHMNVYVCVCVCLCVTPVGGNTETARQHSGPSSTAGTVSHAPGLLTRGESAFLTLACCQDWRHSSEWKRLTQLPDLHVMHQHSIAGDMDSQCLLTGPWLHCHRQLWWRYKNEIYLHTLTWKDVQT